MDETTKVKSSIEQKPEQKPEQAAMAYDCTLISQKLRGWEAYLRQHTLPAWEELPDFGLYMDQVVALLSRYLDFIPADDGGDHAITVSAVNNYVRLKIMPAPEKKKYGRVHLAYLLIICTLKQSISIAYVKKLMPTGLTEAEVCARYTAFVRHREQTAASFIEYVRQTAQPVLNGEGTTTDVENLIAVFASFTCLSQVLTEKLLNLQGRTLEQLET